MLLFLAIMFGLCLLAAPSGVIDVGTEQLVTLGQLARRLPRRRQDRPVSPSTVHRWRHPGIRGVRLECVRVGGSWCTSMAAFREFCTRLSAPDDNEAVQEAAPDTTQGPDRDRRRQDHIERELDRELGA